MSPEARRRSDLRTLARAADGAAEALGSRWWYLTRLALEAALWASQRAEEATGASLADAARVMKISGGFQQEQGHGNESEERNQGTHPEAEI